MSDDWGSTSRAAWAKNAPTAAKDNDSWNQGAKANNSWDQGASDGWEKKIAKKDPSWDNTSAGWDNSTSGKYLLQSITLARSVFG